MATKSTVFMHARAIANSKARRLIFTRNTTFKMIVFLLYAIKLNASSGLHNLFECVIILYEVILMTTGQLIHKYRKEKNLTQKELAAALGLATGTIQQYELGKRQPRIEQLKAIADVLGVRVEHLLGVNEEVTTYYNGAITLSTIRIDDNGELKYKYSVDESKFETPEQVAEISKMVQNDMENDTNEKAYTVMYAVLTGRSGKNESKAEKLDNLRKLQETPRYKATDTPTEADNG